MSAESLTRSTVTHTLLILGDASSARLLFVNERSGATTTYLAVRDDIGLQLEEQPVGRTVRIGSASGPALSPRGGPPTVTLEKVGGGARHHLYRGGDVWAVDRLGDAGLLLRSCGSSSEAAVRENDRGTLGAARVYDVWLSPSHSNDVAKTAINATAEAMAALMIPFDTP